MESKFIRIEYLLNTPEMLEELSLEKDKRNITNFYISLTAAIDHVSKQEAMKRVENYLTRCKNGYKYQE